MKNETPSITATAVMMWMKWAISRAIGVSPTSRPLAKLAIRPITVRSPVLITRPRAVPSRQQQMLVYFTAPQQQLHLPTGNGTANTNQRWRLFTSWYVTSHPGQLSLISSVEWEWVPVRGQWQCSLAGKVTRGLTSHQPCIIDSVEYPPTGLVASGTSTPPALHSSTGTGYGIDCLVTIAMKTLLLKSLIQNITWLYKTHMSSESDSRAAAAAAADV